jgi:hypothetical protein
MSIHLDGLKELCKISGRPDMFADHGDGGLATIVAAIQTLARENAELRKRVTELERRITRHVGDDE